jgi:hypothetical protein
MSSPVPATITPLAPPTDPSRLGFPPTLPIEIALKTAPTIREIFESYGLTQTDYLRLKHDPAFKQALRDAVILVRQEGMSFKMKARLQAEELLATNWRLIHDRTGEVSAEVKAKLSMFTIKIAGYDPTVGQANMVGGGGGSPMQINIIL